MEKNPIPSAHPLGVETMQEGRRMTHPALWPKWLNGPRKLVKLHVAPAFVLHTGGTNSEHV